jgi:hypothetical protein
MRIKILILVMAISLPVLGRLQAAMTPAELQTAVNNLPESTTQQKLKKALLQWGLEDAALAEAAGDTVMAQTTYADVESLLGQTLGNPQPALTKYFPTIPDFNNNFIAQGAVGDLTTLRAGTTTYPRDLPMPTTGERVIADEGLKLAAGLCHPQSPYAADVTVLRNMLRRFQYLYDFADNVTEVDFFAIAPAVKMYLLYSSRYPDLILPSRKTAWENSIRYSIVEKTTYSFTPGQIGVSWVNRDVQHMSAQLYGYELFGNQAYLDKAQECLTMLDNSLYPDGAFPYITSQNECYNYHGVAIQELFYYWQVSGNPVARNIIERSWWYYPLSAEHGPTAEYATAPSWKQMWNGTSSATSSYTVASLTGSGENYAHYQMYSSDFNPDLFIAAAYRSDLAALPRPDNYILYDRNIQGPRGRFGNFSYCGTSNPSSGPSPYTSQDLRGKQTFVGNMIVNGTGTGWDLNAGLCAAYSGPRKKLGISLDEGTYNERYTPIKLIFSTNEQNASLVSEQFASLTTKYQILRYSSETYPWIGKQQWIFTPYGMIGLLAVESTGSSSMYGISSVVKLISGRASWGIKKTFADLGNGTYQYGKLLTKVHAHDYYDVSTEYAYVTSWDGTDGQLKCGRIVLRDQNEAAADAYSRDTTGTLPAPAATVYPAGTKHYCIVEMYPEGSSPSESVTVIQETNGLLGFDVQRNQGKSRLRMIHNPTGSALAYTGSLGWGGTIYLHQSGEIYRPDWMNTHDTSGAPDFRKPPRPHQNPQILQGGNVNVIIEPYAHIVFEKRDCSVNKKPADINGDCFVNMIDFAELAGDWLKCTNPNGLQCGNLLQP